MTKKLYGNLPIPLKRVHIELTNVCDFNCVFCPKSEMKRSYGYMDTALAKSLITELSENKVCEKITFHVMGEPTLHKDFFEILEHADHAGMSVGLTTNGSGLGTGKGKKLLFHRLHQIDVSFQTPDAKSFVLRKAGGINFDNYLKGVFDFFAEYHKKYPETIFKFRFLNTRFSKKSLEKRKGAINVISSTRELRNIFQDWAGRVYDIIGADEALRTKAMKALNKLTAYKWNVIEICPNVFFETYILEDWGHAFDDRPVRDAWAGYCFGMRDHFAVLHNGDVALCCIDYDGNTAIGNLHKESLKDILSSEKAKNIIDGFKKFRLEHPYCKKCLGSSSLAEWLFKPVASVVALKTLKPFFYNKTKVF
ncbi:MAG: SPASM domain-containing protein [Nitrospirae bacterium]|nr:SPASM domain-containing protein [Nitrospirota bacterium]